MSGSAVHAQLEARVAEQTEKTEECEGSVLVLEIEGLELIYLQRTASVTCEDLRADQQLNQQPDQQQLNQQRPCQAH